jgi:hypothetical protein
MGAAISITIAMGFACFPAWFAGRRAYPLPFPAEAIGKVGVACAVMTGCILMVHGSGMVEFAARVVVGGVAYTAAAFATNLLDVRVAVMMNLAVLRERLSSRT